MTSTIDASGAPEPDALVAPGQPATDAIIAGLRAALRELRCIGSQRMLRQGMSMTQHYVLSMLDRHGELTMSRMAEMLDISLSNATGLADRLEERGLVERARVPDDRRIVLVRITERGRALLGEVEVLHEDLLRRVLAELGPSELDRAGRTMADIRAALTRVAAADPALLEHRHRPTS